MTTLNMLRTNLQRQGGFALLPTVVILMVLTLLVMASLQSATILEKMTGNERDYMVAQQAAEAALRDAERDLDGYMANGTLANQNCGNVNACRAEDDRPENPTFFNVPPNATCSRGICFAPVSPVVPYFATPVWANAAEENNAAIYGQFTGAPAIPGVAQQPRYWVEVLAANIGGGSSSYDRVYYRITARAVGRSNGTVVYLQSVYDPFAAGS